VYFNPLQISRIKETFGHAEYLAGFYFRRKPEEISAQRYGIRTLAHLETHEVNEGAFAQLCRYQYRKEDGPSEARSFDFYRICLQDNRILDALERGRSFIKFEPLLLYIAVHELIHVIRFTSGQTEFDIPLDERKEEEERVNQLTQDILRPLPDSDIKLVLKCFSAHYDIGALYTS
jgi:hypothetical protein